MNKFEYKIINMYPLVDPNIESFLNYLGSQGWEICAYYKSYNDTQQTVILKRLHIPSLSEPSNEVRNQTQYDK